MAQPVSFAPSPHTHLKRILGLGFGFAVIFGGTVGVGILRLPGEIAGKLGSPGLILLVWTMGGLYSLLGAISLSEVGAALPQAGGFYVYSKRAFGSAAGFAVGWADWMINCASVAYAARAASEYLAALVPVPTGNAVMLTGLALGLLALFASLQWFGLRLGSGVQKTASTLTAIVFLALAFACFLHARPADSEVAPAVIAGPGHASSLLGLLVPIVAVLPAIVVAYDGWYEAIYFAEEDTNAARHLPRAMIGSVLLITALYLLMNISFLHVLSIGQLSHSQLAAADAARLAFPAPQAFPNLPRTLVTVLSLLTLLSLINALLLGAPRILFAVARDGLFPNAATVARGGTPRTALLLTAAMIAIIILSGKFDQIVAVAAILMAATYCVNYAAVFTLRAREPELARPFRAWGFPVTTAIVLLGSAAFLVVDVRQDPATAVRAVVLLGLALPVYGISRWRMRKFEK
jgi:APA family basic amino acid/polyamine antiporter